MPQATTPALSDASAGTALRAVLSFLTHEVNTPLSLIQGYMDALKDSPTFQGDGTTHGATWTPDTMRRALEAAERNARHCQRLITYVTQTAQHAFAPPSLQSTSATALWRAVMDGYPFTGAQRTWVTLQVDQDFPLPATPELLQLALHILVQHAIESLKGVEQPRLHVVLNNGEDGARILLTHNGLPWPEPLLEALAQHTLVARNATDPRCTGLMFCQRVMWKLQGELRITMAEDGSTLLLLRFPPPDGRAPQY